MSIYKSSSLAMIPTAYKDGKLYSVRPTDGSGDFTFSRGSNLAATRVASSGYIEKGRENLLLQSNAFDTTWTATNITATSGQTGYDGTTDAWLLEKSAASRYIQQSVSTSGVVTMSVYAKAGSATHLRLLAVVSGSNPSVYFNLASGAVNTQANNIDASIESAGGGFYRCSMTFNDSSITAVNIYPADGDGDISGTNTNIIIQDSQLEAGLVATDYIETGASTAKAGILEDMPRLDYSGGATCPSLLLEPQRTNKLLHSEYFGFWNTNDVTLDFGYSAPDGTNSAYKATATGSSGSVFRSAVVLTDDARTIWARTTSGTGQVSLCSHNSNTNNLFTITEEWQRFEVTNVASSSGNTNFYAVDFRASGATLTEVVLWGAQAEVGSYPTSYIPTYGASVTRSVDQLETSPYDYQSQGVLGANVGTIILDCETIGTSTGSNDFHMFGAAQSIADGYLFRANTGTTIDILERDSNTTSAQWTGIATKQTRNKIGVSYSGADVDVYVNGVAKSLSSGTPQGGGNINGFSNSGSNKAGLIIHQILLFPNKLTDSEMASITTL